ncbi:MAG TPA: VWA domain-containing protein [Bryobacteraceae bacterium]|nr:VWA domain-containing protein [Bryobacteraceae bacterium]
MAQGIVTNSSLALPLLLLGTISLLPAQTNQRDSVPEVLLSTDVSRVEVPVRVTDKAGRPVRNLVKDDFVLFDEGKQQVILSADYRGKSQPSAAPAVTAAPPSESKASLDAASAPASPQQLTIICLDGVHTSVASFGRTHEALKKLLRNSPDELPNPAVLISLNPNLRVLQPATNQTKLLVSALDAPATSAAMATPDRTDFYATVDDLKQRFERYCKTCPCGRHRNSISGNDCEIQQNIIRQSIDAQAERAAQSSTTLLDSFDAVIREAAKLPGDKTVVMISDGFALRPGSDFYSIALSYLPDSPIFSSPPSLNINERVTRIGRLAADNRIPINTVNPLGVYTPAFLQGNVSDVSGSQMGATAASNRGGTLYMEAESRANSQLWSNEAPLAAMASLSVGAYLHNDNNLQAILQTAMDPSPDYYVLSYAPPAFKGHEYHRLKVRMVNKEYRAEHREGYSAQ